MHMRLRSLLVISALCVAAPALAKQADILSAADEARETASKLRGLPVKQPIRTKVASRKEVERYVLGRMQDPVIRRSVAVTGAALAALGVVPKGYDIEALMLRMAREQIAGYWDFEKKVLFVADWIPPLVQKPTLVHEFTHALQDQHHDIARFMRPIEGLSEPSSAIAALLEGEATLVMMESFTGVSMDSEDGDRMARMMERLSGIISLASGLADVPAVLRDSLLFPYIGGLRFVLTLRGSDGWEQVDALYRTPPISTEQILHPEKVGEDYPLEVRLPTIRLPGYRVVGTEVMGELGIRLILEQTMEREHAAQAAEGWGGDRYLVLEKNGAITLLWVTVWDSDSDAFEAEVGFETIKNKPARLIRRGDIVAGVWGDVAIADRLIETALRRLVRTRVHSLAEWEKAARARP